MWSYIWFSGVSSSALVFLYLTVGAAVWTGTQKYMPKEVAAAVAKNKAMQEGKEAPALLATTTVQVAAVPPPPPSGGGPKKKGVAQAPAVAQSYEINAWILIENVGCAWDFRAVYEGWFTIGIFYNIVYMEHVVPSIYR
jgi:hypothetical protein